MHDIKEVISNDGQKESLKILINQCWKILPIYEGKNLNNIVVYDRNTAYANYQKYLIFLNTKIFGASKYWKDNQKYIELLYLVKGMSKFNDDEHNKVKYTVLHCNKLIENMIKEIN